MFYNIFYVNLSSNTFSTTYYQSPRYPVNLQQTLGKSEHFYEKKNQLVHPALPDFFDFLLNAFLAFLRTQEHHLMLIY